MNRLNNETRARIVAALVEGNSLRETARMTGAAFNTVLKLVEDIGKACAAYQDKTLRNLPCKRLQADEVWSFCYAKDKNIPESKRNESGVGSVWTWTAICADTKLVPCWLISGRDAAAAKDFMEDLASRLKYRVQLTTDGHTAHLEAVESAFGSNIDYAMLIKLYSRDPEADTRYSPGKCIGCRKGRVTGLPDARYVSTSYAERQNLTMRMSMRRFTRLTNAFSKKIENHAAAVALYFMYYNSCRVHQSLRVTPAMEAGIANHVWSVEEIVALLESTRQVA